MKNKPLHKETVEYVRTIKNTQKTKWLCAWRVMQDLNNMNKNKKTSKQLMIRMDIVGSLDEMKDNIAGIRSYSDAIEELLRRVMYYEI